MKKLILTSVWDLIADEYLSNFFEITEDEKENGDIESLFECDPDYIKFEYVEVPYITHVKDNITYVIYDKYFSQVEHPDNINDDVDEFMTSDKVRNMLSDFYLSEELNYSMEFWATKDDWEQLPTGIKYRNSQGYSYGIYEYLGYNIINKLSKEELIKIVNDLLLDKCYDANYLALEEDIIECLEE